MKCEYGVCAQAHMLGVCELLGKIGEKEFESALSMQWHLLDVWLTGNFLTSLSLFFIYKMNEMRMKWSKMCEKKWHIVGTPPALIFLKNVSIKEEARPTKFAEGKQTNQIYIIQGRWRSAGLNWILPSLSFSFRFLRTFLFWSSGMSAQRKFE